MYMYDEDDVTNEIARATYEFSCDRLYFYTFSWEAHPLLSCHPSLYPHLHYSSLC